MAGKSSGMRQSELPAVGIQKEVLVLAIPSCYSGLPTVEVMSLVSVQMCEMRLAVLEEAFEVVHCNDR